ncbi:hypothetical protein DEVEQU_03816 [Devosia equisanguinis]|uniref:Uncharacterized protein n=1 Tax=Devosia equisanguinis TaxID=2490941 RepID=A0A3S4CGJ3_9HYPH|nr:hypothetical protein [Devosia equisanguinis]VDS06652.1 hypothetical protein DEVEQU_03816 [Devosia equisanguinis]
MLRSIVCATALVVAFNAAAQAQETYTAFEIAEQGLELDAAGLTATFRGKTITVTGTFNRFIDTGYGDMVYVAFDHPDTISWEVSCGFPRDNTAEYDRFALMKPGTEISATGDFLEAKDIYRYFTLLPCQMH